MGNMTSVRSGVHFLALALERQPCLARPLWQQPLKRPCSVKEAAPVWYKLCQRIEWHSSQGLSFSLVYGKAGGLKNLHPLFCRQILINCYKYVVCNLAASFLWQIEVQGYRTVSFLMPFFGAKPWSGLLRFLDLKLLF